jgi:phage N-6-adenine-methyltransferase
MKPEWWSSDEWSTPPDVMEEIEMICGGPFTLDPCARLETAKAPKFYNKHDDGLKKEWTGRVFVNPPYSRIGPWVEKAVETKANGHFVVMLVPAATDTDWFHDHVLFHAQIVFWKRRIRFFGWQGTPIAAPKTPSLVLIYDGGRKGAL